MTNRIMTDDDYTTLGMLVDSPAFGILRKLLSGYRSEVLSQLQSTDSPMDIYRLQGRLFGLNTIENLPTLIMTSRKKKAEIEEAEKAKKRRKPKAS